MKNLEQIAEEWLSVVRPGNELKEQITERAAACESCEQKSYNEEKRVFECTSCGCPLGGKIFSTLPGATCPLNKW